MEKNVCVCVCVCVYIYIYIYKFAIHQKLTNTINQLYFNFKKVLVYVR